MLTGIKIWNFKMFNQIDVELGKRVVFIGPNNSGKTTALQALALWEMGLRKWNEKRQGSKAPEKRPGVTINRRDLVALPVPSANLLWRDLHVRRVYTEKEKRQTENIRVDILVSGITGGNEWECGLEFDYANEESFYCRPLRRIDEGAKDYPERMVIPQDASGYRIAFLPPMSGLAAEEPKWERGRVNVLLGEGQTAQVLRNLCWEIYTKDEDHSTWEKLTAQIKEMFGVIPLPPEYITERGEIIMSYNEARGVTLDISASGRGLQQTLLLLAYLYANPKTVLLLDEPDAHLEILRQKQIYNLLSESAEETGSQLIAATHSEVLLNEAAQKDIVVAFVGSPHRVDNRGSQVLKSLREIGFDQYYQAEQTGWVLYLEGSTDLDILRTFAKTLEHPVAKYLSRPFTHYVANQPRQAESHYFGLQEAKNDLLGIAIFDRIEPFEPSFGNFIKLIWKKREIENYLCYKEILIKYATHGLGDDLLDRADKQIRAKAMEESIYEMENALKIQYKPGPWSSDIKASEDFLEPLFKNYFNRLGNYNLMGKTNFHQLARFIPKEMIDSEIIEKLDAIFKVAVNSKPLN